MPDAKRGASTQETFARHETLKPSTLNPRAAFLPIGRPTITQLQTSSIAYSGTLTVDGATYSSLTNSNAQGIQRHQ
jgi:hypothetical protein